MPRNIRWDESVKENALNLVEALLKQADNEFDDLELNAAVDVEWLTENKLRVTGKKKQKHRNREQVLEVGTRKAHLVKLVEKAGKRLKLPKPKDESSSSQHERELEEVQTALDCLKKLDLRKDEKSRKNQGYWKFTLTLKHQTATRQENLEVVRQKWKEHQKTNSLVTSSTTPILETEKSIDWRNICRTMLEKQKQLTTNRLMRADEMLFDIDRIRVDLALVERKQPDKRSGDDNPAQSQLYKPDYEETQKLEYEEFLATVLKTSQSNKIAVIGEPGAGKTTLLQRIAFWILDNTDGLPIWIPLGNLPTDAPKLKDYLLHNWLEDAIFNVTPKIRAEFEELLTAGRVWLLLDGVDEMVANSGNPLSFIDNWIPGWCQQLSVVLTCRLNVWEANPHALNKFQTYRTLEFSQEKVNEFIEACFQKTNPALGIELQQALNQPGKERIKDLMRNPLRLTLLCSTWHLRDGNLPDTKAELYQQFVEEVYRWKKDEFPTIPEERKQLNAKLKELALAAIDKEENRFCVRHKFVEGILGDRDGCVFQLALNIGWLNRVGVDAKNPNPNQPVYAFFHPTFQEYFAALAIDDWDFFLPRAHDNDNPEPVSERYRIFEPPWKEVILLWLGREDVAKEEKEAFIGALRYFKDDCQKLYRRRAYFLAAVSLAEFSKCNGAHEIVRVVAMVGCGYFDETIEESIAESSRAVLLETDRSLAITILLDLIKARKSTLWYAAEILSKIGHNYHHVITSLIELMPQLKNHELCRKVTDAVLALDHNKFATNSLLKIPDDEQDDSSVYSLEDEQISWIISQDENQTKQEPRTYEEYVWQLIEIIEINPDQPETISECLQVLASCPDKSSSTGWLILGIAERLVKVCSPQNLIAVITRLKELLLSQRFEGSIESYNYYYEILWYYAQNMTYPAFYQAWHQQEEVDKTTTPDRQTLNQADLPQSLQSAIANDSPLSQTIHLICIDSSQFIERDRPAAEIYDQMLDQNCPECNPAPETMPALKLYWKSLRRKSNKHPVLVFYASSTDATLDEGTTMLCPYSEGFLTVLSKFGREICVITEQPFEHIPLKLFAPIQPIEDIVQWIRAIVLEN